MALSPNIFKNKNRFSIKKDMSHHVPVLSVVSSLLQNRNSFSIKKDMSHHVPVLSMLSICSFKHQKDFTITRNIVKIIVKIKINKKDWDMMGHVLFD